jgi:hypothetical protein
MALDFRIRRATATSLANYTPADGELIHETTNNKLYIGYNNAKVELQKKDHTHNYELINTNYPIHMSNTSNPHSTTKSQLGIPNFPNLAFKLISANLNDAGSNLTSIKSNLGLGSIVNFNTTDIDLTNTPSNNKIITIQADKKYPVCDGTNLIGYNTSSGFYNGRLNFMTFGENFDTFYLDGTYNSTASVRSVNNLSELTSSTFMIDNSGNGAVNKTLNISIRTTSDTALPSHVKYYLRYTAASTINTNALWVRLNNHSKFNNLKYIYVSFYMRVNTQVLPSFSTKLVRSDGLSGNLFTAGTATTTYNPLLFSQFSDVLNTWNKFEYIFDISQITSNDGAQLYLRLDIAETATAQSFDIANIECYNYIPELSEVMNRQYSLLLSRENEFYYSGLSANQGLYPTGLGVATSATATNVFVVPFTHFDLNGNTRVQAISKNYNTNYYGGSCNYITATPTAATTNTGNNLVTDPTASDNAYISNWFKFATTGQTVGNIVGFGHNGSVNTVLYSSSTNK